MFLNRNQAKEAFGQFQLGHSKQADIGELVGILRETFLDDLADYIVGSGVKSLGFEEFYEMVYMQQGWTGQVDGITAEQIGSFKLFENAKNAWLWFDHRHYATISYPELVKALKYLGSAAAEFSPKGSGANWGREEVSTILATAGMRYETEFNFDDFCELIYGQRLPHRSESRVGSSRHKMTDSPSKASMISLNKKNFSPANPQDKNFKTAPQTKRDNAY